MTNFIGRYGTVFGACLVTLAVSTSSRAESGVTLYGIVDTGFEWVNHVPTGASGGGASVFREVGGSRSGSRWGLRGREDLGNDTTAIFLLEGGFNSNDGSLGQSTKGLGNNPSTTMREFGRSAYVGLNHKGQQLTFGRQQSLIYDYAVFFDPMGVSTRYSVYSLDAALASRPDDSIKYSGEFGPVTLNALYSTRYDTGYGTEVPGAQITGREYSIGGTYAHGPILVGIAFDQVNSNTVTTNTATQRRVEVGATYRIGASRIYGGYRYLRSDADFLPAFGAPTPQGQSALFSNLYWLGAGYQITPAVLVTIAGYYEDFRNTNADPLFLTTVANYALSKRTDIYVTAAFARNPGNANLGVNGFGTVTPGTNQMAFNLGLRHRF